MIKSVYVMLSGDGLVKVGVSEKPQKRALQIQKVLGVPITVERVFHTAHAVVVERATHALLSEARVSGEWFHVSVETAVAAADWAIKEVEAGLAQFERLIYSTPVKDRESATVQWFEARRSKRLEAESAQ